MYQRDNRPAATQTERMGEPSRMDVYLILHGNEYRSALNIAPQELPYCRPIATCDDTLLAIASGEAKTGSRQEHEMKRARAGEIHRLFKQLADHVIESIESMDTINGYRKDEK